VKLYLDIDGVLLTVKQLQRAEDALPLIDFVTTHFDCYWLTTHCKGDSATAIKYLSKYFEAEAIGQLKKIKPTDWSTLKTEAIDFTSDFFWLEDYPFEAEMKVVNEHSRTDCVIMVDLKRTGELKRIIALLSGAVEKQ
jgi:hypothetical protein